MNKWKLEWEHEKICCAVLSFHIYVEGMATHSSVLAWRIPVDQSLAATVHGVTESDTTEWLNVAKHVDGLNLDQEFGGMLPKKKKKNEFAYWLVSSQKTHSQATVKRRKDLLLAASKKNTGDLSQSHISPTAKPGKF